MHSIPPNRLKVNLDIVRNLWYAPLMEKLSHNKYDLMIIGAGVTGSALLYMCGRYTNIKRIALVEKYDSPARVNSMPTHNSQTLHCGDIETNYSLDKALEVQRAAMMLRN